MRNDTDCDIGIESTLSVYNVGYICRPVNLCVDKVMHVSCRPQGCR